MSRYSDKVGSKPDSGVATGVTPDDTLNLRKLEEVLVGRKGFDFTCRRCGSCCQGPGDVFFTDEDLERIYLFLEIPESERRRFRLQFIRYRLNGYHVHSSEKSCFFLKQEGCSIYSVRPVQCSTFPFWPSLFRAPEDLEHLQEECPGSLSGKGQLYSDLTVVRRVNHTFREFLEPQKDTRDPIML